MLKVVYVSPWVTIHPGLQHTLIGDLVLSNQFEALIGVNEAGVSVPLGAKQWSVSDDFRIFKFEIDTTKTFPDGVHLSPQHFKDSWEAALKLIPKSANSSLLDVLYKVEGFDHFADTGRLSGLRVHESTLEVRFTTPFRMALEHLQGNRFAAYRVAEGRFLGTGQFEISEKGKDHLIFYPRGDQANHVPTLDVSHSGFLAAAEGLKTGACDVIAYATPIGDQEKYLRSPLVELLIGQDAVHLGVGLNATKGSLFEKREMRQAFQYLFWQTLKGNPELIPAKDFFDADPQVYMPFQSGRLDPSEVEEMLKAGAPFVNELLLASRVSPLRVGFVGSHQRMFDIVKLSGIAIADGTGPMEVSDHLKTHYAQTGPEILIFGFGIASGDPDGIYHKLGAHGAIRTPYVFSQKVSDLLEEGRQITDLKLIDDFYRKVSRAILSEVPMIHFGFSKAVMAYRKDRVHIDSSTMRRNQGQLHFLRAR